MMVHLCRYRYIRYPIVAASRNGSSFAARPESTPREGANPRHDGRYDKTPAGDADEGPVKRKAQVTDLGL
jgi:hypothetical protein